jgi:hypothetical protein
VISARLYYRRAVFLIAPAFLVYLIVKGKPLAGVVLVGLVGLEVISTKQRRDRAQRQSKIGIGAMTDHRPGAETMSNNQGHIRITRPSG